jgi:hypothetical protein
MAVATVMHFSGIHREKWSAGNVVIYLSGVFFLHEAPITTKAINASKYEVISALWYLLLLSFTPFQLMAGIRIELVLRGDSCSSATDGGTVQGDIPSCRSDCCYLCWPESTLIAELIYAMASLIIDWTNENAESMMHDLIKAITLPSQLGGLGLGCWMLCLLSMLAVDDPGLITRCECTNGHWCLLINCMHPMLECVGWRKEALKAPTRPRHNHLPHSANQIRQVRA